MEPERLQVLEAIFHAALEVAPEHLDALLGERCGADASLRLEVEALLAGHRRTGVSIDTPVAILDERLFEEEEVDRLVGQSIGHWEILKRIGSGGMGTVYLARRADRQFEQRVAIKLIKRGMDTAAVLRRFRNERQILAGFDHPNIARLLDGDTTESGLPYFVMEYVDGLPIDEYCNGLGLSVAQRLQLFRQVCAAVSYAHRHAVIHRDLKPSNILVTADGVPKLLDFGIARLAQPGSEPAAATVMELRVMTPEYASPEQVLGEPVTTASDVYSLGVVLYRLLTGRLPYKVESRPQDFARTITEMEPARPSVLADRRQLRGDLDNIVLMALRKEPERRYQSIEQFSDDIGRHLATLPVLARRDTLAYRAGKFVRRNTAVSAAAALVVLSLVGGIVATSWQAQRAQAEKARAERRFNEVRQLAHAVLFDYHDAIKDLHGATAVRERLVRDGLTYLDSLAGESSDDPALQRELAAAYERLGDVRGRAFTANLGDMAGARESYLKALQIRESIAAANPRDVQSRRDVAGSYVRIGAQFIRTNEAARGTDYLRKALAIYLELVAEQPADREIRYDLAAAYDELGQALEDWWGDSSGALQYHNKALALRQEFVATDPGSQIHRRNLSVTYVNIGRALVQGGDTKGALESNRKGLAIRAALFSENPSNADFRRLLAISHQNEGNYQAILGNVAGALRSYREKLALDQQSLTDDPANVQTREDLGYSNERIGDLLAETKDHAHALSYYRKALALYEGVLAVAPQLLHVHYRVIFAHAGIARMQAELGQQAAALAEGSEAHALLSAIRIDPNVGWQNNMRARLYMHLAEAFETLATSKKAGRAAQREHLRTARDLYARSLEIWQDMQRRGILTVGDSEKPREVARAIAQCDESLGDISEATTG